MNNLDFKALSKTLSKEILFDLICNQKISEDELTIYKEEVRKRGLERELSEMIENKEHRKIKIKNSVKELSKEELFNIALFNIDHYSKDDLVVFKEEIESRGLGEEFSTKEKLKEADDLNFKKSVLNNSNSPEELLKNFNNHIFSEDPEQKQREGKKQSFKSIIIGLALILIGGILTLSFEGGIIFYGAILVGLILILKGIFDRINNRY